MAHLAQALDEAWRRAGDGIAANPDFRIKHRGGALDILERLAPSQEDLVVCHGDYCFPNVLVEEDRVTGYVDLGELAVADRWWDLAIGSWSTTWNIGPGWEQLFFDSFGVAPDHRRIAFYRLLYDLIPS